MVMPAHNARFLLPYKFDRFFGIVGVVATARNLPSRFLSIIAIDQHYRRPEGNSYIAALGHVFASNPTGLNITKDIVVATQEQDAMAGWI
jgi:hypothetical protein